MPTSEREPELYWTDMSDPVWAAQNAPWSAGALATLARNTEVHKRTIYGLGSYLGDVPHDHKTGETAHLSPAVGVNIVQASCPALTLNVDGDRDAGFVWTASGWSIAYKLVVFGTATYGQDDRAVEGGVRGGWVTQRLYALTSLKQARMFGGGADLVCSVFLRMTKASTRGMLQFGLSSMDSSDVSVPDPDSDLNLTSAGSFIRGQSGLVHYTDLDTEWKRFFLRVPGAGNRAQGDIHITLSTAQTFTEKVQATGFAVTHGRRLYPWGPSPADVPQTPWSFGHAGWQNMPQDTPLLDWAVSMDNAVPLEPI